MAALKPTPKLAMAGVSGLASGLLVFVVKSVFKVDMPEEVAIAIVGVGTWLGGWLKRDKSSPVVAPKL